MRRANRPRWLARGATSLRVRRRRSPVHRRARGVEGRGALAVETEDATNQIVKWPIASAAGSQAERRDGGYFCLSQHTGPHFHYALQLSEERCDNRRDA